MQHHILDALAPLSAVIEASGKEKEVSLNEVLKAVKSACKSVANTSCKISELCRERTVQNFNKSLLSLVRKTDFEASIWRLQTKNMTCHYRALQDGRPPHNQGIAEARGLVGIGGCKGHVFYYPSTNVEQEVLHFCFDHKIFQFNCLPFGLSSVPLVFTKTLNPFMSPLWELGVCLVIYINDILLLQAGEDHATSLLFL